MTRLSRFALFALLMFGFAAPAISADEKTPPSKTFAVIVGVGQFKDADIKGRPTADTDAKAIGELFTDKTVGGIPADQVQMLIAGQEGKAPTKENLLAAFKSLAAKAGKEDKAIIVWIGQGASVGERTCLFASDSTFKDRAKNGISAIELEAALKGLNAKEVCALLDLDLKAFNPGKESVADPAMNDLIRTFLGGKEKDKDVELPSGRVLILARTGTESPLIAEGKEGIFAKALIAGLRGAADSDGYEPDGIVTVDELTKYLDNEIPELGRKYGKTKVEREQIPWHTTTRSSHFALSKNPAVTAKVEARLKKLETLYKQQKVSKEVAEEGERLLSRMPALKPLRELRKNYQALLDGTMKSKEFDEARETILAGMKLDDDAARSYAQKLIRGLEKFKGAYIKELNLGEMTANAIKGLYTRADQRIPTDINDRLGKAKELDKSDLVSLLQEARLPLGKREDFDKDRDVEISLQYGIAKFVDPYTAYIDRLSVEESEKGIQGFFTGIGVQIRREGDGLLVVTPIKGSPAYVAGLKAGDLITKIRREVDNNGKKIDPPEVTSTKGMQVSDAVKLIVGKPGTKVKIIIERPGEKNEKEIEIARGLVEVESVLGYKRKSDDSWDFYIDPKSKIAYMYLTQFARKSFIDMEKVMKQLDKDGVKGLILDVRFNPGGYLDVAKDICDLFIDDGLIVTIKPRVGEELAMTGKMEQSYQSFPMVCLVNGGSASGSEILAACLQDHHRAIVMGERSYGKGSVQNIQKFEATGGEIKLTTATFWRPNGKNLNKASTKGTDEEDWGVRPAKKYTIKLNPVETAALSDQLRDWANIPNRELKSLDQPEKKFDDRQLDAAVKYIKEQIKLEGNKEKAKKAVELD